MCPATGSRFSCLQTPWVAPELGQASLAFNPSFGTWPASYSDKPPLPLGRAVLDEIVKNRLDFLKASSADLVADAVNETRGPRPLAGYIGVQNHDALSTAYFKEIAVKRIPRK